MALALLELKSHPHRITSPSTFDHPPTQGTQSMTAWLDTSRVTGSHYMQNENDIEEKRYRYLTIDDGNSGVFDIVATDPLFTFVDQTAIDKNLITGQQFGNIATTIVDTSSFNNMSIYYAFKNLQFAGINTSQKSSAMESPKDLSKITLLGGFRVFNNTNKTFLKHDRIGLRPPLYLHKNESGGYSNAVTQEAQQPKDKVIAEPFLVTSASLLSEIQKLIRFVEWELDAPETDRVAAEDQLKKLKTEATAFHFLLQHGYHDLLTCLSVTPTVTLRFFGVLADYILRRNGDYLNHVKTYKSLSTVMLKKVQAKMNITLDADLEPFKSAPAMLNM
jgi:hypothetical protein